MAPAAESRDCVADATASAKLCYTVLCHEGPHTQSELARETGLDRKTVQRAVSRLIGCGVVTESVDPTDARRTRYEPLLCFC